MLRNRPRQRARGRFRVRSKDLSSRSRQVRCDKLRSDGGFVRVQAVTGLVDSVSILSLGRVFVANMTGNVAFIGFALAGKPRG